jgi:DNA-binding MarR family transcriptional regulator
MGKKECMLSGCLYFSSNKFVRLLTKLAEDEFKITGLTPTYAFAVTIVNKYGKISSTELADYLQMAPSTITRFVDKLLIKDLVGRKIEGKNSFIFSTEKGKELQESINIAWNSLEKALNEKLGEEESKKMVETLNWASERL